jgi:hypothetical protein
MENRSSGESPRSRNQRRARAGLSEIFSIRQTNIRRLPGAGPGGGKEIRTPDLLIANETLYQLSYTPGPADAPAPGARALSGTVAAPAREIMEREVSLRPGSQRRHFDGMLHRPERLVVQVSASSPIPPCPPGCSALCVRPSPALTLPGGCHVRCAAAFITVCRSHCAGRAGREMRHASRAPARAS